MRQNLGCVGIIGQIARNDHSDGERAIDLRCYQAMVVERVDHVGG